MRTKTIALAAGGALALSTLGGVAVAVPTLTAAGAPAATGTAEPADAPADDDRRAERADRIAEHLSGLVDDGTLTQEQADKVADTLAQAGPSGHGHGGPFGRGEGPGALFGVLRDGLEAAADVLGLDEDDLRDRLVAGETLGEVADAEGVAREDLVGALETVVEERLAEEVAEGDLTQERADEIAAELTERITEGLDRSFPGRGDRPGRPGGQDDTSGQDDAGEGDS